MINLNTLIGLQQGARRNSLSSSAVLCYDWGIARVSKFSLFRHSDFHFLENFLRKFPFPTGRYFCHIMSGNGNLETTDKLIVHNLRHNNEELSSSRGMHMKGWNKLVWESTCRNPESSTVTKEPTLISKRTVLARFVSHCGQTSHST